MILALDTSMGGYSLALLQDQKCLVSQVEPTSRELSENLVPVLKDLMSQANASFGDLTHLVMATGPGTFTGIRVGYAMMKTLSIALDFPLYGVTTFDVCAGMVNADKPLLVVLDSKRAEPFVQSYYRSECPFQVPANVPLDVITGQMSNDALVIGNALETFQNDFETHAIHTLDPLVMVELALEKNEIAVPFYVRPPDVTLKK